MVLVEYSKLMTATPPRDGDKAVVDKWLYFLASEKRLDKGVSPVMAVQSRDADKFCLCTICTIEAGPNWQCPGGLKFGQTRLITTGNHLLFEVIGIEKMALQGLKDVEMKGIKRFAYIQQTQLFRFSRCNAAFVRGVSLWSIKK